MRKLIKWLSSQNIVYDFCLNFIAYKAIRSETKLSPEYLGSKGWVEENGYWVEPRTKGRDKIWVEFESHYYRVYHGENRTFIALESSLEWFEVYYLFVADRVCRYEMAGI